MQKETQTTMQKKELLKPDGRKLWLYGHAPLEHGPAPSPSNEPVHANPHLRWHPLRGEWVTYAGYRQNRPFLPPDNYNPLAPTTNPEFPTELPTGNYDVAVFQNRFPSLSLEAHDPPESIVPTAAGKGECEVVVFTQDSKQSLGTLPLEHIRLLIDVWADRYTDLGSKPDIQYVMPFENRGVEMGVTLHHPHGQIYAYDHIPPVPARELEGQRTYFAAHGRGLLEDHIRHELEDGARIIVDCETMVAFVPVFARYPYEVWLAPKRAVPSIVALSDLERDDFARVLKILLYKYDHLFEGRPLFPYLMVMHQAPTDGFEHPEAHLHLEFYPPYRTPDKLKYLAGTELGAGLVAMDNLPENTARDLQAVAVPEF